VDLLRSHRAPDDLLASPGQTVTQSSIAVPALAVFTLLLLLGILWLGWQALRSGDAGWPRRLAERSRQRGREAAHVCMMVFPRRSEHGDVRVALGSRGRRLQEPWNRCVRASSRSAIAEATTASPRASPSDPSAPNTATAVNLNSGLVRPSLPFLRRWSLRVWFVQVAPSKPSTAASLVEDRSNRQAGTARAGQQPGPCVERLFYGVAARAATNAGAIGVPQPVVAS